VPGFRGEDEIVVDPPLPRRTSLDLLTIAMFAQRDDDTLRQGERPARELGLRAQRPGPVGRPTNDVLSGQLDQLPRTERRQHMLTSENPTGCTVLGSRLPSP
jgi:hypothetical protein